MESGMTNVEAEDKLKGTVSANKNEILYQNGINYNNEPAIFRKGTVLYRDYELAPALEGSADILEQVVSDTEEVPTRAEILSKESTQKMSKSAQDKERKSKERAGVQLENCDLINNDFWHRRPWILSGRAGRLRNIPALAMLPAGDGESLGEGVKIGQVNGEDVVGIEIK